MLKDISCSFYSVLFISVQCLFQLMIRNKVFKLLRINETAEEDCVRPLLEIISVFMVLSSETENSLST